LSVGQGTAKLCFLGSPQDGFSGSAIVYAHPLTGILRIKITTSPPESLESFVTNYLQFLNMSLGAMNVEALIHIAEEEKE